jgi:hypothetical protein
MQFQIPQNVQREDTIFLNVTLKQLLILLVGGGIAYSVYIIILRSGQTQLVAAIPGLLLGFVTVAVAFLKIRDMTFLAALLYFIEYSFKPKFRVWKQGAGMPTGSTAATSKKSKKQVKSVRSAKDLPELERRKKLMDVSKQVDRLT